MNKVVLATGSDYKYLNKIQPYLNSLEINSNFDDTILVYIGEENFDIKNKNISIAKIPKSSIKALNINNCIQHGEFIYSSYFDELKDSDIIFYTDGDMFLQRKITHDEKKIYSNFKDGDVYIGYNASPTDSLKDESQRIGFKGVIFNEFNFDWNSIKIYNTGLIAMNKKTWKKLTEDYIKLYPLIDKMFSHYAKQQWLISFLIGTDKYFNIIEMGYEIHNHRHYPSPVGTTQDKYGNVYYNNELVLFKHKWT